MKYITDKDFNYMLIVITVLTVMGFIVYIL